MRFGPAVLLLTTVTSFAFAQTTDHVTSGSQLEDLKSPGMGAAPSTQTRPLFPLALGLIKEFEGWSAVAYNDPSDYCTIGYGHLIALEPCTSELLQGADFSAPISPSQGDEILRGDTVTARRAVTDLVPINLNDQQFGALTSFVFNVGKGNFEKSTMLRLLRLGDVEAAATQFSRWTKSKGQVLGGLVDRRACEESLFRGTLRAGVGGTFRRQNCQTSSAVPAGQPLIDVLVGE